MHEVMIKPEKKLYDNKGKLSITALIHCADAKSPKTTPKKTGRKSVVSKERFLPVCPLLRLWDLEKKTLKTAHG